VNTGGGDDREKEEEGDEEEGLPLVVEGPLGAGGSEDLS